MHIHHTRPQARSHFVCSHTSIHKVYYLQCIHKNAPKNKQKTTTTSSSSTSSSSSSSSTTTTVGCYLGHKNQHHNRCGSDKETETRQHTEQINSITHKNVKDEDDHKNETADISSQDDLSVVIQSFHFDFSGFKSHHNCSKVKKNLVAIQHSKCNITGKGVACVYEESILHHHNLLVSNTM